jgi:antitoxin MazE9
MKLSVSIPEEDVEFLDSYAQTHHIRSRSATVQRAIRLLRSSELASDYAGAFDEWADDEPWDGVVADGLPNN